MKISRENVKRFLAGASIALVLGGCSPKQVTPEVDIATTQSKVKSVKSEAEAITAFVEALKEEQEEVIDFFGEEKVTPVTEEMKTFFEEKKIPKEYLSIPYITNIVQKAMDNGQESGITYDNGMVTNNAELCISVNDKEFIVYTVMYNMSCRVGDNNNIFLSRYIYSDSQQEKEKRVLSSSIRYGVDFPNLYFSEMVRSSDSIGTRNYTPEYGSRYFSTAYEYENSGFGPGGESASGKSVEIDREDYLSLRDDALSMLAGNQGKSR